MNNISNSDIKLLFAKVKAIIPEKLDGAHEWLIYLEQAAYDNSPGWIDTLRGFLRGLWGAEVIELEALDDMVLSHKNRNFAKLACHYSNANRLSNAQF